MSKTKVLVSGGEGKVGRVVADCLRDHPTMELWASVDVNDDLEERIAGCDVVIDFTAHDNTVFLVQTCVKKKAPLVMGTTGHSRSEFAEVDVAGSIIPIVYSSNFSCEFVLFAEKVRNAAGRLGVGCDVEILDFKDAEKEFSPSGTAEDIGRMIAKERGQDFDKVVCYGRNGKTGRRPPGEIGVHSIRGGETLGEVLVKFLGKGMEEELRYKTLTRREFAEGAFVAAQWIRGKKPGLYSMRQVMGLDPV